MACFWIHQNDTDICIPETEETDGITIYKIEIKVSNVSWFVKHRYKDFYELHQQLVTEHGVSKDILPPKKVIKNKCPIFIEGRRKGLEAYLKSVFNYLQRTMPRIFLQFLNFHEYDIFFLLQNMALQFYTEGDTVLQSTKHYTFSVLELHAISKCFKEPYPAVEETDRRYDLSHVLDLCSQLHHLKIKGFSKSYKNSNIIPNDLSFDLLCFKSLQSIEVVGVGLGNVYAVGNLRDNLKKLQVNYTTTTSISQILMCDAVHKATATDNEIWHGIEEMDLSFNNITVIDKSMRLVPGVRSLTLTQNKISDITNLSFLTKLSHLVLANNLLSKCDSLHTKLGNVVHIDLSQNSITSLQGFEKLYSLESLDVSCNHISDMEEIRHIGSLPCLENLRLTGNPVAVTVDYRVKVLENFGTRTGDIYLDNEKPTQKEMDTACILQALRIVKEGKTPNLSGDKCQ